MKVLKFLQELIRHYPTAASVIAIAILSSISAIVLSNPARAQQTECVPLRTM